MKKQADGFDKEAWEHEGEDCDEALHKHPFPGVLDWVTVQTGISSDRLRKAALKRFEGCTKLVKRLRLLDGKGQTGELWERLVKECPLVLREAGLTPPTGKTGEGEGSGGAGEPPRQPAVDSGLDRATILANLEPADRKAYLSFQYAETKKGKKLEDQEAYKWLKENGIDTDKGDLGELADYKLPTYDTWSKQVRNARRPLGEQKYTKRGGRASGKSIVSAHEIEYQHGDE